MSVIDVLLLFEHSGYAAEPFTKLGYTTAIVDIQNSESNPRATYTLDWDILVHEEELASLASTTRLVIGFPPCTDLAVSGAMHFDKKAWIDPDFQQKALHLFRSPERIAGRTTFMIENPVSRVSSLWRKPNFTFHPWEYGGYLPEDDVHPEFPEYIFPRDAYPKKTCLWTSDNFTMPPQKWVPMYVASNAHLKLGGKSQKTKNIHAASPRGFFVALAQHLLSGGIP